MKVLRQTFEDVAGALSDMEADWMDATAQDVVAALHAMEDRDSFNRADLRALLDEDFERGLLIVRLFLGLSKDELSIRLPPLLGAGGFGVTRWKREPERLLDALEQLGATNAMTQLVRKPMTWRDVLTERLRSGRGRAVRGQIRGRSLEDFIEAIVASVFGASGYDRRNSFTGRNGQSAKFDFAIPDRHDPRILIEAKGYGATGSKQSDVLGDLRAIINAKRPDTRLLFVTDGLTWLQRASDLRKIIELQNHGDVTRIYTRQMSAELEADLRTLRQEEFALDP